MDTTPAHEPSATRGHRLTGLTALPRHPLEPLLRAAIAAPSGYNSQPWKFSQPEADAIDISPDWARTRPVVDPDNRELFLSLGAVVENILIAASHFELTGSVTLPGVPGSESGVRIRLSRGAIPDLIELKTIRARRTNRMHYTLEPVPASRLAALEQAASAEGVTVAFAEPASHAANIRRLYCDAHLFQRNQPGFLDEFLKWSRFSGRTAERFMDGLIPDAVRVPKLRAGMGRKFIRQYSTAEQQAELELSAIFSAPHLAIIAVDKDNRHQWIAAGRSLQRMLLLATQFGISSAYHNAPCQVPGLRDQAATELGLGSLHPVAIVRLGYGPPVPATSRRTLREFFPL